jgi:hypothetical protein
VVEERTEQPGGWDAGMGTAEGGRRRIREAKPPSDDLIQEFKIAIIYRSVLKLMENTWKMKSLRTHLELNTRVGWRARWRVLKIIVLMSILTNTRSELVPARIPQVKLKASGAVTNSLIHLPPNSLPGFIPVVLPGDSSNAGN